MAAGACLGFLIPAELALLGEGQAVEAAEEAVAAVDGMTGALVIIRLALRHGDRDSIAIT